MLQDSDQNIILLLSYVSGSAQIFLFDFGVLSNLSKVWDIIEIST